MHEGIISDLLDWNPERVRGCDDRTTCSRRARRSGRLHIQYVSTRRGVEMILRCQKKKRGSPGHHEAVPHHFTLTDEAV